MLGHRPCGSVAVGSKDIGASLRRDKHGCPTREQMKIILAMLCCMVLCSCTAFRENLIGVQGVQYRPEEIQYLKVALIGEDKEPSRELLDATVRAFQSLRSRVGIDVGAYTYCQVSLDGAKTMNQIYDRLYQWHAPMEPGEFDIGILYTHKLLAEDAAGIVLGLVAGMPIFVVSTADVSTGRFVVTRSLGTIEHEIAHLFCAMDGWDGERNRKVVLEHKWRKYDSRGFGVCQNFEDAYPDTRDPNVWSDKYPEVVQRAKERARKFEERKKQL